MKKEFDQTQVDKFGFPLAISYVPEAELLDLIESYGLTVGQTVDMKKTGELPPDLLKAWDDYQKLNDLRFGTDSKSTDD